MRPVPPTPNSPTAAVPVWVRSTAAGVEVDVLAQPRASRSKAVGEHDGRLKLQLAAPPVDGAANEALVSFLAERLGVAQRQVELLRGETSRRKTVLVHGLAAAEVARILQGDAS